jgi:hypothetical protein
MYINMTVERTYGILKVRSLLLHVKALLIDAAYVGVYRGGLVGLLQEIVEWRSHWFEDIPDRKKLVAWYSAFYDELKKLLAGHLIDNSFHVPQNASLQVGRNLLITPSDKVDHRHTGMTLPEIFGGLGRRYFNLQHRINRFEFFIPMQRTDIPDSLLQRHDFIAGVTQYNAINYPYFVPVAYGLQIFR